LGIVDKKSWGIGGLRKAGALEGKEGLGHWRIKKGWNIVG
jgi:hypothetical protein